MKLFVNGKQVGSASLAYPPANMVGIITVDGTVVINDVIRWQNVVLARTRQAINTARK